MSTQLKMCILAVLMATPFHFLHAADPETIWLEPREQVTLEYPLPKEKKNFFIYNSKGTVGIGYDDSAKVITIVATNLDGNTANLSYEDKPTALSITMTRPIEGSLINYGGGIIRPINGGLENTGPLCVNLEITIPRKLEGKVDFDKPSGEDSSPARAMREAFPRLEYPAH